MERFCIGFYTLVPPMARTDAVIADTGHDPPDPPLSLDEWETIARAAKTEFLRVMRRRAEASREAERGRREAKEGKFTKPQAEELLTILREGPQPTYGSARTRVQNILKSRGLTRFTALQRASHADRCDLTPEGREVATRLREEQNRKSRAKERKRLATVKAYVSAQQGKPASSGGAASSPDPAAAKASAATCARIIAR